MITGVPVAVCPQNLAPGHEESTRQLPDVALGESDPVPLEQSFRAREPDLWPEHLGRAPAHQSELPVARLARVADDTGLGPMPAEELSGLVAIRVADQQYSRVVRTNR